jgi:hypothetical protein
VSVTRGFTFTHASRLDPDWVPGLGQKYVDAPKQRMEVTRATSTTVYFRPEGSRAVSSYLPRAEFEARYMR